MICLTTAWGPAHGHTYMPTIIENLDGRKKKKAIKGPATNPWGTPTLWRSSRPPWLLSQTNQWLKAVLLRFACCFCLAENNDNPPLSNLQGSWLIPLGGMYSGSSLHFMLGWRDQWLGRWSSGQSGAALREGWVSLVAIFRRLVISIRGMFLRCGQGRKHRWGYVALRRTRKSVQQSRNLQGTSSATRQVK